MTTFKFKPTKVNKSNTQITLHLKHSNAIHDFDDRINKLKKSKDELELCIKRHSELSKITSLTVEELREKNDLSDKIKELIEEIDNIENNVDELDYFSQTIDIISDYYKINDFTNSNKNLTKSSLCNMYDKVVNKQFCKKSAYKVIFCTTCNIEKLLSINDSAYVCPGCGQVDGVNFEIEKSSTHESTKEGSAYYKRINHFIEWLNQIQGKEATVIPDEVHNQILKEIKKSRITDLKTITPQQIRAILKKLHLNKYYEHIFYIINKITGLPPPTFSREIEEKFRQMFKQIQEPFAIYCPKEGPEKRKNFLSYSYVLYKFCEILELDSYLKYFTLLKNRSKLLQQDLLFSKICKHLHWQFLPSL